MKLIKGLLGVVIGLVAVIVLALWILPAKLIHWGIEEYGSQAVGAQVDVGSVDFSWLSSRLQIQDIAVTNPGQPMRNSVELQSVTTQFDLMRLFDSKVYLDLVLVDGIVLDGERAQSGALPGAQPVQQQESGFTMPDLGLPGTDELIAKEKAIYQSKIDGFNQKLDQRQKNWQGILDGLPGEDQLQAYEQQWEQAQSGNVLEKIKKADKLRKQVKRDIKQIKQAQNQIEAEYLQVQKDYSQLSSLSDKSVQQIIQELGLSDSLVANMGDALLTGKVQQWLQMGFGYYQTFLGGESGSEAASTADAAQPKTSPDFLIKLMRITGSLQQQDRTGTVEGQITNISEAPSLHSDPIAIDIKAMGEQLGKLAIEGKLDHTSVNGQDQLLISIKDSLLQDYVLSQDSAFNLLLEKAKLNFAADANIQQGKNLNLAMNGVFTDLAVQLGGDESQQSWAQTLVKSLSGMERMTLDATAKGEVSNPKLKVSTNLNGLFKSALGGVIKEKTAALKSSLKGQLDQVLEQELSQSQQKMNDLGRMSKMADERLQQFNDLVKNIK